ncbi:MAG: mammalian cell entry protein, partial [Hydrogenophaga sp.]|nr:mammalian cell entry protein [Hydrogenophaga sp.]
QKVDKLLVDAQAITANTREATTDLAGLRAEVDASLRKVDSLINEVNRLWPLKRDAQIELK